MKTIIALLREATVYFKDNSIIMQFIPIFLILFYSVYRYTFIKISHSLLGKLFAIMLILYYTRIDFVYGTVFCILTILYYQLTEREGFESISEKKTEKENNKHVTSTPVIPLENFELINKDEPSVINIEMFNAAKDEFIKEKCKNGVLMYKDFPVKSEMADHVYSEIKYNTNTRCNPCDRTCDYNIIEAKLKTESMLNPKSSNDLFDAIRDIFMPKREKIHNIEATAPIIIH
jgi:hypothetical protein